MAEIKSYTMKHYPEESKQRLEKLLEETKEARVGLDKLDDQMRTLTSPTPEILQEMARKATGWTNYMRKKFKHLGAAAINEKDARYMEIKIECNQLGITFVDSTSKIDAEGYIAPLRTLRDIFEAYVVSGENIVSTCRLHFYNLKDEEKNSVEV